MRTSLPVWATLAALLACAGCDGVIADPTGAAGQGPEQLDPSDPGYCEQADIAPGAPTLRRLNRVEYNNTVRDLLGDTSRPADEFPDDDVSGDGFDNNGDVLAIGNLLMEKYDTAARGLVARALEPESLLRSQYLDCPAETGDEACARQFFREFGLRAWRRPLTTDEVDRLWAVTQVGITEGEGFDGGLGLAMRAMLLSPSFLFHVERNTRRSEIRPLGDFELASRLSYFLWSSMPDEELFGLADEGALQDRATLAAQVDRMLADPKAEAFYDNFVSQWLHLRRLEYASPDPDAFPGFDAALRASMQREATELIRYVVESNGPIADLLTARYAFLNERLADHYGVPGVTGDELRRVELETDQRGGVLTLGSVLTTTSHPDVTSPVRRGEWVLDNLLCAPPPDPPADVDTFIEEPMEGQTLRERLEQHRADPACATCHSVMDPLGFGLENYDPTGAWRTEDNGAPVDASGELPDGRRFDGARELSNVLAHDERYSQCVTKKLMAYALGRGVEHADRCFVERVLEEARLQDLSLREIIVQIVTNDVFTMVGGRLEGGR